jgi:hypothetical protein
MDDLRQCDCRIDVEHSWRHALPRVARAQLLMPDRAGGMLGSRGKPSQFIWRRAAESGCSLTLGRIAKRPLCAAWVGSLS